MQTDVTSIMRNNNGKVRGRKLFEGKITLLSFVEMSR